MDENEIKHVVEAALLAAGRPLTLDKLAELFAAKGSDPDRAILRGALDALAGDYQGRGIELKEVATGFRIQVKRSMSDWLQPLWEERAPRYTRALLETLALIAYRQPITRAEIEEVRGVVVSTNIVRTLLERNWIRVVGHRDVPGKPAMFGTTKDFLDYFGLKRLEDLPPLADIKDGLPELSPQADLIETLEAGAGGVEGIGVSGDDGNADEPAVLAAEQVAELVDSAAVPVLDDAADEDDADDSDLEGPDLLDSQQEIDGAVDVPAEERPKADSGEGESADSAAAIPRRAAAQGLDGAD
jgi:segregation and condensation protein B